jgi:hypothetical protein
MRRVATLLGIFVTVATAAVAQVDSERAQVYFKEVSALCERDGGRLWGMSLCGPMVIADAITRTRATSEPAPDGEAPPTLGYANAAIDWGGKRWSAYVWQFIPPDDPGSRQQLMLHELFHRIQPALRLMPMDGDNGHLDTSDGRYWLRLEWRALLQALRSSGADSRRAIGDALAFRMERRRRIPTAAENERVDEIREGLAEYTGIAAWASSPEQARIAAMSRLASAGSQTSFVRTFAYASGAGYGILLDTWSPGWTRRIQVTSDLGDLLMQAAQVKPSPDLDAAARRYDAADVRAGEDLRERIRQNAIAELRRRFVDGPVLTMPAAGTATADNRDATTIPGAGTVLREIRLTAAWGHIDATGGALRSADGSTLIVPAPASVEGSLLKGDGWTATINRGWIVRPASRPGSFEIVRQE